MTTRPARRPRHHAPLWQRPFRALAFITATCDTHGDPSLTKILAREYSLITLYDMAVHGINAANLAMAALCLSAAFGKSVWVTWLAQKNAS